MSPKARRGKWVFVILAGLIIADQLFGVLSVILGGLGTVDWLRSIVLPLCFAAGVLGLWFGDNWLRWLMAIGCMVKGGVALAVAISLAYRMAILTPPEQVGFFVQIAGSSLGILAVYGLFYVIAGSSFLLLPSLRAFFEYQRRMRAGPFVQPDDRDIGYMKHRKAEIPSKQREQRLRIGEMSFPSGCLLLADPQYIDDPLRIEEIPPGNHAFFVDVIQFPEGGKRVAKLTIEFREIRENDSHSTKEIGQIGIDSARLVVVDREHFSKYWTKEGPDRPGVVATPQNRRLVKLLKKRFDLHCSQVNPVRAEVVQPISRELERKIEELLRSIPEYSDYPFMHFHVQTNNTFERVNYLEKTWAFLSLNLESGANLFVVDTGWGDGVYPVVAHYCGNDLAQIEVVFIEPGQEPPHELLRL